MITRRGFVKTLPALTSALAAVPALTRATEDASKVSLVVGNSTYPGMQLHNPVNDARAVSELLASAGFRVDMQLDVNQSAFIEAIERFGKTMKSDSTKLAVFFYAGHGVQLDWRNYLLPVNARVSTGEELKARCVDLGVLLDTFADAKDKTHVVILDACRNDPFGGSYRPAQSGLSQVDAPVGSLLAYSTSPGSVAFDGEGKNGLYTKNLLREWSRRDANLENVLKRVRLNVRLESQGRQIPWESTSLESEVFIFDTGRKKLSDAELENYVKEDLAAWERISSSQNPDDWVEYLRAFPDGRFAEIAQFRLTRLLASRPTAPVAAADAGSASAASAPPKGTPAPAIVAASAPAAASSPQVSAIAAASAPPAVALQPSVAAASATTTVASTLAWPASTAGPTLPPVAASPSSSLGFAIPSPASTEAVASALLQASGALQTPDQPAVVVVPGGLAPRLTPVSANPYSKGRYALGRVFSVGDEVTYRVSDMLTGLEKSRFRIRITRVDESADIVEGNNGRFVFDSMGNEILSPTYPRHAPAQTVPVELQIGKKWHATWAVPRPAGDITFDLALEVAAREVTRVSEVDFDAFRIEARGSLFYFDGSFRRLVQRYWIVPGLNFKVKGEYVAYRQSWVVPAIVERIELVSLRQHRVGQIAD
ncbi:caspase family protein [Paraburkholderia sp. HD33-4]|uniref:caspase family protein n=1 Tax=Paraburkholderia sp. HD33-4 TaxID=2883242 RepID=UPI001F469052|nr:caspase family protein [Paraburkholderia sp. HD33-4]